MLEDLRIESRERWYNLKKKKKVWMQIILCYDQQKFEQFQEEKDIEANTFYAKTN